MVMVEEGEAWFERGGRRMEGRGRRVGRDFGLQELGCRRGGRGGEEVGGGGSVVRGGPVISREGQDWGKFTYQRSCSNTRPQK